LGSDGGSVRSESACLILLTTDELYAEELDATAEVDGAAAEVDGAASEVLATDDDATAMEVLDGAAEASELAAAELDADWCHERW